MEPRISTCSAGEMKRCDLSTERRRYALEAELPGLAELQSIVNVSLQREGSLMTFSKALKMLIPFCPRIP